MVIMERPFMSFIISAKIQFSYPYTLRRIHHCFYHGESFKVASTNKKVKKNNFFEKFPQQLQIHQLSGWIAWMDRVGDDDHGRGSVAGEFLPLFE